MRAVLAAVGERTREIARGKEGVEGEGGDGGGGGPSWGVRRCGSVGLGVCMALHNRNLTARRSLSKREAWSGVCGGGLWGGGRGGVEGVLRTGRTRVLQG